jgi:hypothetical protein
LFLYIAVAIETSFIAHSFCLHGRKYKAVRFLTELAIVFALASSVVTIVMSSLSLSTSQLNVCNLILCAIFNVPLKLSEYFVYYYRFLAVAPKPSGRFRVLLNVLIFVFLLPPAIFYFPLPFIGPASESALGYVKIAYGFGVGLMYLYLVYDFALILYRIYFDPLCKISSRAAIFSWKALLHCGISIAGLALYICISPMGLQYQNLLVVLALHALFNVKIENYISKERSDSSALIRGKSGSMSGNYIRLSLAMVGKVRNSLPSASRRVVAVDQDQPEDCD